MMSLKTFLPQMSQIWGASPAALYERQRALVRLGVMEPAQGRGPGSGVPLTADNVAALVIALAITDNLSDTDGRVAKLCAATPLLGSACPFTGAETFRDAMAAVLGSVKISNHLEYVSVDREELGASIGYRPKRRSMSSSFQFDRRSPFKQPAISTKAMICPGAMKMTASIISNALSTPNHGDAE